jgi:hypothetical protein
MPVYYGRRYYRRYRRRFGRRAYSSTSRSKRRAIGNFKAALQQKDKTDVSLSISHKFSAFTGKIPLSTGEDSNEDCGVYALNIWDLLRRSEFYQSYANMYDQIKINSIRIKLTPYSFNVSTPSNIDAGNIYHSYTVVTAWDRTGLSNQQILLQQMNPENINQISEIIGGDNDDYGLYVNLNGQDISTYSSAITKSLNMNSNTNIIRAIYPSNLMEKSLYINTADLEQWYPSFDNINNRYYGFTNPRFVTSKIAQTKDNLNQDIIVPVEPLELVSSDVREQNPCFLVESSTIPFKPTFLVGLLNESYTISTSDGPLTVKPRVTFNLEADIGVTFRGLRKAPIVV